jgi:hypothetical protein
LCAGFASKRKKSFFCAVNVKVRDTAAPTISDKIGFIITRYLVAVLSIVL